MRIFLALLIGLALGALAVSLLDDEVNLRIRDEIDDCEPYEPPDDSDSLRVEQVDPDRNSTAVFEVVLEPSYWNESATVKFGLGTGTGEYVELQDDVEYLVRYTPQRDGDRSKWDWTVTIHEQEGVTQFGTTPILVLQDVFTTSSEPKKPLRGALNLRAASYRDVNGLGSGVKVARVQLKGSKSMDLFLWRN